MLPSERLIWRFPESYSTVWWSLKGFNPDQIPNQRLLPIKLFVHVCFIVQDFKHKSVIFVSTPISIPFPKTTQKDNLHNFIFVLTKDSLCVVLTISPSRTFYFPRGVMNGEKPLNHLRETSQHITGPLIKKIKGGQYESTCT